MSDFRTRPGGPRPVPLSVVYSAGVISFLLFILLNISDWPGEFLAPFWRDHPIIGASLGTLLLIAVGYFAFDYHDRQTQRDLDEEVAAAGRSGVVDHLVDVDVALSLVAADESVLLSGWPGWNQQGRPLRWLRQDREELLSTDKHRPAAADPRSRDMPPTINGTTPRIKLVDQAVRRVSSGIRDWGPVMSGSRSGKRDLVDLGRIRTELLQIQELLSQPGSSVSTSALRELQNSCRGLPGASSGRAGRLASARSSSDRSPSRDPIRRRTPRVKSLRVSPRCFIATSDGRARPSPT